MEIIEYKRTCNKCGNVWYVPKEYLKRLKSGQMIGGMTALLSDFGQGVRNSQAAESEIMRLQMCSKCNSTDFVEELETSAKKDHPIDPSTIIKEGNTSKTTILISVAITAIIILILIIFSIGK